MHHGNRDSNGYSFDSCQQLECVVVAVMCLVVKSEVNNV